MGAAGGGCCGCCCGCCCWAWRSNCIIWGGIPPGAAPGGSCAFILCWAISASAQGPAGRSCTVVEQWSRVVGYVRVMMVVVQSRLLVLGACRTQSSRPGRVSGSSFKIQDATTGVQACVCVCACACRTAADLSPTEVRSGHVRWIYPALRVVRLWLMLASSLATRISNKVEPLGCSQPPGSMQKPQVLLRTQYPDPPSPACTRRKDGRDDDLRQLVCSAPASVRPAAI